MGLLTAGYWPTTYWPEDYWNDDYWLEFGIGATYDIAGSAAGVSGADATLRAGNKASGIDESIVNEFRFPHVPSTLSPELALFMNELRQALESQFVGDRYIGGDLHVDGDLHLGGSQV